MNGWILKPDERKKNIKWNNVDSRNCFVFFCSSISDSSDVSAGMGNDISIMS